MIVGQFVVLAYLGLLSLGTFATVKDNKQLIAIIFLVTIGTVISNILIHIDINKLGRE